ncbi:MAG: PilN domain-containing protein [Solirubrobacteraceae bacterium]
MRAVNLIPAEQRTGQPVGAGRSQGGAYAVLVLVGGLALMAYAYGSAQRQVSSKRGQVASLTAQAQQVTATAERLAPYTSFVAQRESRTQAVKSLVDSRFDWAHVFHEFGRVLPAGVSVTALAGQVGSTTVTPASSSSTGSPSSSSPGSATPPGSVPTFTLSGCATSQPTVALTLQRLRLIDGVKEVSLQSSTAGPKSSGSNEGASSGGCSSGDPVFSVQISFDPLPSQSEVAAATKTVSDRQSKRSPTGTAGSTGSKGR